MNRDKRAEAARKALRFEIDRMAHQWILMAPTTKEFHELQLPAWRSLGWTFVVTCDPCEHGKRWHLSAKLYPVGRGSTEKDWLVLGLFVESIAVATGHSRTIPILPLVPFKEEHPNAAHHFAWHPDGTPVCDDDAGAAVRMARAIIAEREKGAPN